jgi:hypothetical protein
MNKIVYFILLIAIMIVSLFIIKNNTPIPQPQPQPIPIPIPEPKPPTPIPGSQVDWFNFPIQQNKKANTPFLTDIVSHLPTKFGNQYFDNDPVTWGHETTHGIHSHLRNVFGKGNVAFYVGNNKAAFMSQPKMKLKQISDIIPNNLRGSRYNTYFVNQLSGWNGVPLYVFDEWVAYTNGAAIGLETPGRVNLTPKHRELHTVSDNRSDVMVGALEFSIYAILTCVAIDKYDPSFLQNKQYKEFVASELKRSIDIYRKGIILPQYIWDTPLEKNVRQDQSCINILNKMYGNDLTMRKLFDD